MKYDVGICCSVLTWNLIVEYPFIWTKKSAGIKY